MRIALATAITLTLAVTALASPGIFTGELIPAPEPASGGAWLYVKGRNSMVRRVDIASAKVFYAESVAKRDRREKATESLLPGAQVRVTADQNAKGEWRAQEVEITRIAASR